MDEAPIPESEARHLRFLKWLVTVLTATMILGVLAIVALLVIRLQAPVPQAGPVPPALPATISLPQGARATAVTAGAGWFAVVTDAGEILIYTPDGTLRQRVAIED